MQCTRQTRQVFTELVSVPTHGHVGGRLREAILVARNILDDSQGAEYTLRPVVLWHRSVQVGSTAVRGGPWLRPGPQDTWPARERESLRDFRDVVLRNNITGEEQGPICAMSGLSLSMQMVADAAQRSEAWAEVYQVILSHEILLWFLNGDRCAGFFGGTPKKP